MQAESDERVRRVRGNVVGQKVPPPWRTNRRCPRRTSEEMCRSLDAPWDAEEILLGLNFWTVEEFAQHAKVTIEEVKEWMGEGLPVLRLRDGSGRISEAAADEWAKGRARKALAATRPWAAPRRRPWPP